MLNKYDKMLIDACKKKGLEMNVNTANQYRKLNVLNRDYYILEHVPTGIRVCKYSKEPTYVHEGNKIIAEWNFQEL